MKLGAMRLIGSDSENYSRPELDIWTYSKNIRRGCAEMPLQGNSSPLHSVSA